MDEFDFEVTPLKQPQDAHSSSRQSAPKGHAPLFASRRLDARQRLLRAGCLAGTVLIALLMLLIIPTANRESLAILLRGPTPTPTTQLVAGYDRFGWEHTVPWGSLLIDGRAGPDVRRTGAIFGPDAQPQTSSFRLTRGRHVLEYRAELFPPLRCTVSVPASADDSCPLDLDTVDFLFPQAPLTRVLDFRATIERLPADQIQALADATQEQLTAAAATLRGAIAPGDHYRNAEGQVVIATQAMIVAPRFTLAPSAAITHPDVGAHCARLCSFADLFDPSGPDTWNLAAPVDLTWRYTTPTGHPVFDNGPPDAGAAQQSSDTGVVAIWDRGEWRVRLAPLSPPLREPVICAAAGHSLDVLQASPETSPDLTFTWSWPYAASTDDLGCLLAGSNTFDIKGEPSGNVAYVFYHNGVMLAANAEAHHLFPQIPLPSTHERALIASGLPDWA